MFGSTGFDEFRYRTADQLLIAEHYVPFPPQFFGILCTVFLTHPL